MSVTFREGGSTVGNPTAQVMDLMGLNSYTKKLVVKLYIVLGWKIKGQ